MHHQHLARAATVARANLSTATIHPPRCSQYRYYSPLTVSRHHASHRHECRHTSHSFRRCNNILSHQYGARRIRQFASAASQQQQQQDSSDTTSQVQKDDHLRNEENPATSGLTQQPTTHTAVKPAPAQHDDVSEPANPHPNATSTSPMHSPVVSTHNTAGNPKVVALGTGWASFMFVRGLDRSKFDVYVISPRNHFLFTPLLASTTTGTLEYRNIIEPIRTVPDLTFYESHAENIDFDAQIVQVKDVFRGRTFDVPYDYLVIGVGSRNATFNVPGVREHAHFLKNIRDAQAIRNTILSRFEEATSPLLTDEERRDILRVIVVGGGPTSVEFAAEMYDFLGSDIKRTYPDIVHLTSIVLVEATDHLLSAFDKKLSGYVTDLYKKRPGMTVHTGLTVKELTQDTATFSDGKKLKYGCCVWSTGLAPNPLIERLPLQHQERSKRLVVNEYLQVHKARKEEVEEKDSKTGETKRVTKEKAGEIVRNVYSFGDCAVIEIKGHPATAQVASAEALYLSRRFNKYDLDTTENVPKFQYRSFGQLAYVGARQALADLPVKGGKIHGFFAYLFWRGAYITKLMSWKNRFLVAMHWINARLFGRDIARF